MGHDVSLCAQELWEDIEAVRRTGPLVHNITNLVVMSLSANVLLAAGASPVMAHAHEEVADMAGIAQALVLNIGTLDPYWVQGMKLALAAARARGIPVVLDPVGAGATPYRNRTLAELLDVGVPAVIRGNGSEIMSRPTRPSRPVAWIAVPAPTMRSTLPARWRCASPARSA